MALPGNKQEWQGICRAVYTDSTIPRSSWIAPAREQVPARSSIRHIHSHQRFIFYMTSLHGGTKSGCIHPVLLACRHIDAVGGACQITQPGSNNQFKCLSTDLARIDACILEVRSKYVPGICIICRELFDRSNSCIFPYIKPVGGYQKKKVGFPVTAVSKEVAPCLGSPTGGSPHFILDFDYGCQTTVSIV